MQWQDRDRCRFSLQPGTRKKAREQAVAVLLTDAVAVIADNNLHFLRIAGVQRDFCLTVRRAVFHRIIQNIVDDGEQRLFIGDNNAAFRPSKENSIFLRRA